MFSVLQPLGVRLDRYWLAAGAPSASPKEVKEVKVMASPELAAAWIVIVRSSTSPAEESGTATSALFFCPGETSSQARSSGRAPAPEPKVRKDLAGPTTFLPSGEIRTSV